MKILISFNLCRNPKDVFTIYKDGSVFVDSEYSEVCGHFNTILDFEKHMGKVLEDMYSRSMVRNIKLLLDYELYRSPLGDYYEKRGDIYVKFGEFEPCSLPYRSIFVPFSEHPYKDC
jgi:hypothetical protein